MPYILPDGVPETICQNSVSGWGSLEGSNLTVYVYVYIYIYIFEGSLEVKLPTIWRDEKQSREEA